MSTQTSTSPQPVKSVVQKIIRTLPKTVNIGSIRVGVVCNENYMRKINEKEERHDAAGYTMIDEQEIVIDPGVGPDIKADTLLHEVLHWIFYLAGGRESFGQKKEEKFICIVTSGLIDTLKRNPELVEYILGED